MTTKNILKIGYTTDDSTLLGKRDAFHAPAVLVQCMGKLKPCDNVRFVNANTVELCKVDERHGIADPFIPAKFIPEGLLFWVLLNPESTSNLKHHFDLNFLQETIENNKENEENEENQTLKKKILDLEDEVEQLRKIKERFEGYDDDDSGCKGCY